jgi:hypothetical protein
MIDYGGLESYCDSYRLSEEQDVETTRDKNVTGNGQCVHLLQCPRCNGSATYPVEEELI